MYHKKKQSVPRKKQECQSSPTGRKKRKDTSVPRLTSRDELVLTWIGQQYAMRLDQIQELLGQLAGHGAAHEDAISESATLNVIARWKQAGWVMARRIDVEEPQWVWLTKKGLRGCVESGIIVAQIPIISRSSPPNEETSIPPRKFL